MSAKRFIYPYVGPAHKIGKLSKFMKRGRAAIALEVETPTKGYVDVRVGYAYCSPKDNFCRKKGRRMAEGRLVSRGELGPYYFEVSVPDTWLPRMVNEFVVGLVESSAPQWGRW